MLIVNEIPETIELVYKGGELTPDGRFGLTVQLTYPGYPNAFIPNEVMFPKIWPFTLFSRTKAT